MKNFSTQKLLIVALMLLCAASTRVGAEEPGQVAPLLDGREWVRDSIQEKVGEPHEIKRAPLFDNLPFLKLKRGDELVKAKYWFKFGKGEKPHFAKTESYFLLSDGKYYELETDEKNGKVFVSSFESLLFDWDVTLPNATRLYKNARSEFDEPITLASFAKLKEALRKDFPETLRDVGKIEIKKPHLEGSGKTLHAVFQGLGFDAHRDTICKYQFEIGNGIYKEFRKNLIVGPRRVDRWEYEGLHNNGTPNGPADYTPDAATAAKARAAYDRMMAFQNIVNKFLVTPRTKRSELNY